MVIVIRTIIYYNNLGSRVISQFINNMFYLYTFIMVSSINSIYPLVSDSRTL